MYEYGEEKNFDRYLNPINEREMYFFCLFLVSLKTSKEDFTLSMTKDKRESKRNKSSQILMMKLSFLEKLSPKTTTQMKLTLFTKNWRGYYEEVIKILNGDKKMKYFYLL